MARNYQIDIDAGATFQLNITYTDPAEVPIDLTGYVARMQIRESVKAATAVLELENGSGITLGGAAGTIDIAMPPAQTEELKGDYVYDLEIESGGGVVTRLIEGIVRVSPEVSR